MTNQLVDGALRSWKQNVDRAGKLFSAVSEEDLLKETGAGQNRLIYLWGHVAAANDAMLPLLGLGERLHPELDEPFLKNPDGPAASALSRAQLAKIWTEVHDALWAGFAGLSADQWVDRHTAVSPEDFVKEPHRNRFSVLLSRTSHIASHVGQAVVRTKIS